MACISKYGEEGAALLRWDAVAGSSATRMARVPGGGEAPGRCLSLARWALRGSWGPLSTQASGFRQCPRSLSACCPATVDMLPAKPRPPGPKARPGRGIPGVLWPRAGHRPQQACQRYPLMNRHFVRAASCRPRCGWWRRGIGGAEVKAAPRPPRVDAQALQEQDCVVSPQRDSQHALDMDEHTSVTGPQSSEDAAVIDGLPGLLGHMCAEQM